MTNSLVGTASLDETAGAGFYRPSNYIIAFAGSNNEFNIRFTNASAMALNCKITFNVVNKTNQTANIYVELA